MRQTIAQKIIARAAGAESVAVGDYVTVTPDYTVMQDIYFWKNIKLLERLGVSEIAYPDKVIAVLDHTPQATLGTGYAARNRESREFARRTGFKNFFKPRAPDCDTSSWSSTASPGRDCSSSPTNRTSPASVRSAR